MIDAHIQDGVAVTKFLYWIKNSNIKNLDEIKVEKKLESFRKRSKNFFSKRIILVQAKKTT